MIDADDRDDVARVREVFGDREARRYRAVTDLHQMHLGDFSRPRHRSAD